MTFPERFADLPEYAFPRLRRLLGEAEPGGVPAIDMTIGEPKHPMPDFVPRVLADTAADYGRYPPNEGTPGLRAAIADWIRRRYDAPADFESQVFPLNGTREGLFNAALALCPETKAGKRPAVLIPNPFYQVYEVAARAAGAEPVLVDATEASGFLPDFAALPADVLDRAAIAYVCSPSNPQGAVADDAWWDGLIALAERHDIRIFADECYSEIWRAAPPPGGWTAAARAGADPERVAIFHSLSKRSNLPGLRAGFVAAGPGSIARMKQLRAYAGAPLPLPVQHAAEAAWRDEAHVEASRALYQEKFARADAILGGMAGYRAPQAGFFLWIAVPEAIGDGEAAARLLWRRAGVRVLPGAYLGRDGARGNPGTGFVRVAMVAGVEDVAEGLARLRTVFEDEDGKGGA